MAIADTVVTTATSTLNKVWRKIQGTVSQAIQFDNAEWDMFEEFFAPEGTPWSAREVTIALDINKAGGVASISEGGIEARENSKNLEEITITLVHFNARFNISKLVKFGDEGSRNQVTRDLTLRGLQKVRAMGEHWSDYVYGYSTGRLARTSTNVTATTQTLTLDQGYDSTVTDATYIMEKFRVGDWVASIDPGGTLKTNGIGEVTAVGATLDVTFNGSLDSNANDLIVKANSKGNTVLAATDYNKGLVGLLDMAKTASVHALSSVSVADWAVANADTAGGRMTGIRLRSAADQILDEGGGKATHIVTTRGVRRDLVDLERPALRYSDPIGMEIDGSVKMKGLKIIETKKVPPGYCFVFDKSALSRWNLLPKPDGKFAWADGKEYIDQSAYVFALDMPCATLIKNRKKLAYFSGLTES